MSRGLPRVLVLTGTGDYPFPRLLDALPALVRDGVAAEVRVQSALPVSQAPGVVALGMLTREDVASELAAADVVITHGGSGSCFDAIRAGHRPIVVPRRVSLGEHVDDHQIDVAAALHEKRLAVHVSEPTSDDLTKYVSELRRSGSGRIPAALGERLRPVLRVPIRPRTPSPGHATVREVRWAEVTREEEWTETIAALGGGSALQGWAWGEASCILGRRPIRWILLRSPYEPVAAMQALEVFGRGPLRALWAPGGPCLGEPREEMLRVILRALRRIAPFGSLTALALAPSLMWTPSVDQVFRDEGLQSFDGRRSSTMVLDLRNPIPALRAGLTKNWRHNLNRSERHGVTVREIRGPEELPIVQALYEQVTRRKGIPSRLQAPFLNALYGTARTPGLIRIFLAIHEDRPTAMRVVGWGPHVVHDLFAGADDAARHSYANYAMVWHIIERACQDGLGTYDLGGIDPIGNPGVFDFKRGLGGKIVIHPGVWLLSRAHRLLRVAVGLSRYRTQGRFGKAPFAADQLRGMADP